MLEKIYWRDICGLQDATTSWQKKEELIEAAREVFKLEYISVGWVIYEDEDFIVLAATHDGDELNERWYHDSSMIMKSVIVRREILENTLAVPLDDLETGELTESRVRSTLKVEGKKHAVVSGKKERICGKCGRPNHRADKCPNIEALREENDAIKNNAHHPLKDAEEVMGDDKELVWDIRSKFIVQGLQPLHVCEDLGITMQRFIELCKKYDIHR